MLLFSKCNLISYSRSVSSSGKAKARKAMRVTRIACLVCVINRGSLDDFLGSGVSSLGAKCGGAAMGSGVLICTSVGGAPRLCLVRGSGRNRIGRAAMGACPSRCSISPGVVARIVGRMFAHCPTGCGNVAFSSRTSNDLCHSRAIPGHSFKCRNDTNCNVGVASVHRTLSTNPCFSLVVFSTYLVTDIRATCRLGSGNRCFVTAPGSIPKRNFPCSGMLPSVLGVGTRKFAGMTRVCVRRFRRGTCA